YADVTDMVMSAGVDAARDVQVELADFVQEIEVVEAALDRLGHGNGDGVGQRTEIAAGTGDDVGQQADVGRGQSQRVEFLPQLEKTALAHVGQDQVLFVGNAQLAI